MTVTCQMPGATDIDFFLRADMTDTKLQVIMGKVTPSQVLAEQHGKMAEPGTGGQA